jgi:ATP-binding cassette, subfamily B, bacterial PglK
MSREAGYFQMPTKVTHFQLILRLWQHLSRRRRIQFVLLFVLMVVAAFADMVSIGAVLPFLGILTAPEDFFTNPTVQPVIAFLGIEKSSELIIPFTIIFICSAVVAAAIRFTLLSVSTRFSFVAGHDISTNIFRRTLYQPYEVHTVRNSSTLISGITEKTNIAIYNILMPVLVLLSSSIMLIAVITALIVANTLLAVAAFVVFGGIYGGIIKLTSRSLKRNSECIAHESTQVIKSLQEALGGIRDVLIDGSQELFCRVYRNADWPLRRAQGDIHIISGSPRFLIEALGMIAIAITAYILAQDSKGIVSAIPILGVLAISAQRLLPVLQSGYGAVSSIKGSESSLVEILTLLDQVIPDSDENASKAQLQFQQEIRLDNLSYSYKLEGSRKLEDSSKPKGSRKSGDLWIFKDVNFVIEKGTRIGFVGKTGSGKSTLLDIIMGLLKPTKGSILIDGQPITGANLRTWQEHIAHVPQNIYLTDGTLSENIAFGVPKDQIDHARVRLAASRAQIADDIESWQEQYNTLCGERGIRLSGGQRQRIGIARALYKKAEILILDEATSALDSKTEQAVMNAIDNLEEGLTILVIAHRLSTLESCDKVIEVGSEGVKCADSKEQVTNGPELP